MVSQPDLFTKKCWKCGEEKSRSDYYVNNSKKDKLTDMCKVCSCAHVKRYRDSNPELYRKRDRERYYNNPMRRNNAIARACKDQKLNPEAARKRKRKWEHEHKDYMANKQSRKRTRTPKWASEFCIGEAYDIARRRTVATGIKWHVDHIVPLTSKMVCGLHVENNLQVITATTNILKGNRHWPDMP